MIERKSIGIRPWLAWLTCLGFACRALVPVGYMPAAVGEGGPFVLCYGGVTGMLLRELAAEPAARGHAHVARADHAAHEPPLTHRSEQPATHAAGQPATHTAGQPATHAAGQIAPHAHDRVPSHGHDPLQPPSNGSGPAFYDCPIGIALGAPAVASSVHLDLLTLDFSPPVANTGVFARLRHAVSYRSRAPPVPVPV